MKIPPPLPTEWTEKGLIDFLSSRSSEDKHFECKTSIHFSWDLKNFTDPQGNKPFTDNPFHSSKPINSYLALRAIESIIAFANAEGGLLFLVWPKAELLRASLIVMGSGCRKQIWGG